MPGLHCDKKATREPALQECEDERGGQFSFGEARALRGTYEILFVTWYASAV